MIVFWINRLQTSASNCSVFVANFISPLSPQLTARANLLAFSPLFNCFWITCLIREQFCGKLTKCKKIDERVDKPYYDRMHQKLTSNKVYATRLSRIRSRTVEPVLGTLINFLNLKRLNSRGMQQANKHVLMCRFDVQFVQISVI